MKKIVLCLVTLLMVLSFFGCIATNTASSDSSQMLSLNKKYVSSGEHSEYYFIFYKNGTGKYNGFYESATLEGYNDDYEITFKYLIIEDTVVCFYDGVTYGNGHGENSNKVATSWTRILGFSKDILINTGANIYICEDYLPNIPNFNS